MDGRALGNHVAMPDAPTPAHSPSRDDEAAAPDLKLVAWILGSSMLAIWAWWALAQGAYFGTVLLPGAIFVYLLIAVTFGFARIRIAPRGPHVVALGALLLFSAWTALSIVWSPARDLAVDYAQRNFAFAAAFAAGLILAAALRRRVLLAIVPFLGAGAIAVAVTLIHVRTAANVGTLIDDSGTLQYPFSYRNANAGFFAMIALGSIPVMVRWPGSAVVRAGVAALAAAALSLVVVSQSRGSVLGVAAGCIVLFAVSKQRLPSVLALGAIAIPVAIASPQLLDPFDAVGTGSELRELQQAMTASALAGAGAALISLAYPAIATGLARVRPPSPGVAFGTIVGFLIAAVLLFSVLVESPVRAVEDGFDKIANGDRTYGDVEGSRFTYAGGLSRLNFWDVALQQAADDPLTGGGAGSFRSRYLVDGEGDYEPRNAHSLPLETLGELGAVGLLLLLAGFTAAAVAAARSRRCGRDAAILSTTALVVAAVMLAQAAVDWSWYFGAQTAPMLALLGSAAAPAAAARDAFRAPVRIAVAAVAGLLALTSIPTFVSQRLTLQAGRTWRADPEAAYSKLDTAADLNPVSDVPLLLEAEIANLAGDENVAAASASRAIERSPENWRGYVARARALADSQPKAAEQAAIEAVRLNPASPLAKRLQRRLAARPD